MKKMMMLFSVLLATSASAAQSGRNAVDAEVVASAEAYIASYCDYERADVSLVLQASSHEARRYDQMLYDHYYSMTYASRSSHSGSINPGVLILSGAQNHDETRIRWTIVAGQNFCR